MKIFSFSTLLAAGVALLLMPSLAEAQDQAHRNGHNSVADGIGAVAFGNDARTDNRGANDRAIVFGHDSESYGDDSVAVGYKSRTVGLRTVAIGTRASTGTLDIRYGNTCDVARNACGFMEFVYRTDYHNNAVAIGYEAEAWGESGIAIGMQARNHQDGGVAIGWRSFVESSGSNSLAIGAVAYARKGYSVALGTDAQAYGLRSVALGRLAHGGIDNNDGSTDNTGIGHHSRARGVRATALGEGAIADGPDTAALGHQAHAGDQPFATAIGTRARASQQGTLAIGHDANTNARAAIAIGGRNSSLVAAASEEGAIAIGFISQSRGTDAIALGQASRTSAADAIALGQASSASGAGGIAIGHSAHANHAGSIAIGRDAATSRVNQILLGNVNSHYRLPGLTSQASRDLLGINPVELITADSAGTLSGDNGEINTRVWRLEQALLENPPGEPQPSQVREPEPIEPPSSSLTLVEVPESEAVATNPAPTNPPPTVTNPPPTTPTTPPTTPPTTGTPGAVEEFPLLALKSEETPVAHAEEVHVPSGIAANQARSSEQTARIAEQRNDIDRNTDGVALAMALYAPPLLPGKTYSVTLGFGNYEDGNALGVSGSYRVHETVFFSLSGGVGLNESDAIGGRLSFTFVQ